MTALALVLALAPSPTCEDVFNMQVDAAQAAMAECVADPWNNMMRCATDYQSAILAAEAQLAQCQYPTAPTPALVGMGPWAEK